MELGKILKEKRISNGLTQAELASKAGVTIRAITYWENGKKHMTVESADKVFRVLGAKLVIGADGQGEKSNEEGN